MVDRAPARLSPARTVEVDSLGPLALGRPFPADAPGRDIAANERMLAVGAWGAERVSVVSSEEGSISGLALFFSRGYDAAGLVAAYTREYGQPDERWTSSGAPLMECVVWWDAQTRLELLWVDDEPRGRIVLGLIEDVSLSPERESCVLTRYIGSARPMSRSRR